MDNEIRIRKPSTRELALEKSFSAILKYTAKLVEILHNKNNLEEEEEKEKSEQEFLIASKFAMIGIAELNSRLSSYIYSGEHPGIEKLLIELKLQARSLSQAFTFLLGAFGPFNLDDKTLDKIKRKEELIHKCLENIRSREVEINKIDKGELRKTLAKAHSLWVTELPPDFYSENRAVEIGKVRKHERMPLYSFQIDDNNEEVLPKLTERIAHSSPSKK